MSSPSGQERRRAFRVDDEVHLDFQLLDEETEEGPLAHDALQTCRALMQLRELSVQSGHLLANIRKQHSEIAQFLALLDKKIDAVAQIAGALSFGDQIQPNAKINLSASGMAFTHHSAIPVPQRLAIRLVLFPNMLCIQPRGRVVYCREQPQASSQHRYRIGVEFEPLAEQEQDMLIRHLLERQSAERRRERGLDTH